MTNFYSLSNKLASLEAKLFQNSAYQLTNILTGVKCRATNLAKNDKIVQEDSAKYVWEPKRKYIIWKLHHSPVDYVEDEEYNGEDDKEGDVDEGVVVLLPLAASQLPELHLHQDGSVPAQQTVAQITFIFKKIHRLESCCGSW